MVANIFLYSSIYILPYRWCDVTISRDILEDLLPGPVTLVFDRKAVLNPELNPSTRLVGVRIPDHQFIRATARVCKEPIALTSANISASRSCLTVEVSVYSIRKIRKLQNTKAGFVLPLWKQVTGEKVYRYVDQKYRIGLNLALSTHPALPLSKIYLRVIRKS